MTLSQFLATNAPATPEADVFTPCTTSTPRQYASVLLTEANAYQVVAAIGGNSWVTRNRAGTVTGVCFASDGRLRSAVPGDYIVTGQEYGLTLYQSYTAEEYADTYTPREEGASGIVAAAKAFAETWSDEILTKEAGLNCAEANALVGLLVALGYDDAAEMWANAHALRDEPGDEHHQPTF